MFGYAIYAFGLKARPDARPARSKSRGRARSARGRSRSRARDKSAKSEGWKYHMSVTGSVSSKCHKVMLDHRPSSAGARLWSRRTRRKLRLERMFCTHKPSMIHEGRAHPPTSRYLCRVCGAPGLVCARLLSMLLLSSVFADQCTQSRMRERLSFAVARMKVCGCGMRRRLQCLACG